jgi:hypothetical protein
VVLSLALGEGRDFQLLAAMLAEGTLPLVDKVYIKWRYQLAVSVAMCLICRCKIVILQRMEAGAQLAHTGHRLCGSLLRYFAQHGELSKCRLII